MSRKRILLISGLLAIACIATLVSLEWKGIHMFKTPVYIREASPPSGFPAPGPVRKIVIKSYPSYRAAVATESSSNQNEMFRRLFNHINENEIAMTSPVEMTFNGDGEDSMAFLYADPDLGATGSYGGVEVVDVPATDVVSIGVRGSYRKGRFENHLEQLEEWLDNHEQWRAAGRPRYLGFNSPLVPAFFRYGEIQIPIEPSP